MTGTFIDPSPLLKNLSHRYEMVSYGRGSGNGVEKTDWSVMAIYKKDIWFAWKNIYDLL